MKYHRNHLRSDYVVCLLCRDIELQNAAKDGRKVDHEYYEIYCGEKQSSTKFTKHLETHVLEPSAPNSILNYFNSLNAQELAVIKYLVLRCMPFSEVENEHFRALISAFQPNAKFPSRDTIQRKKYGAQWTGSRAPCRSS